MKKKPPRKVMNALNSLRLASLASICPLSQEYRVEKTRLRSTASSVGVEKVHTSGGLRAHSGSNVFRDKFSRLEGVPVLY